MPCCPCQPTGLMACYGDPQRRASALVCGGCEESVSPPAQNTGWVIPPGQGALSSVATKTLPNGLVITATITNRGPTGNNQAEFRPGTTQGDSDPNALLMVLEPGGEQFATVDFTTTTKQGPNTVVRVIDIDSTGGERLLFPQPRYRRNADENLPIIGNDGGLFWHAASQTWRAAANNRSSRLTFNDEEWGGSAGPLRVQFRKSSAPLVGTMFDFSGPLRLQECDREVIWVDSRTGEEVDAADLVDCAATPSPTAPDPCELTDPATLQWTANGDGTFSKDLGQGFVITGRHVAGTHQTDVRNTPQCSPASPASMLSFNTSSPAPCSYALNDPSTIEFTATRPWPAPFAIRVFDIDGNHNTAKHASPNETVAPSWGIPDSVEGPHASSYRDKGAGQVGANGAPADGRDFTLVYDNPPANDPLTFNWHGCCIAFGLAIPESCNEPPPQVAVPDVQGDTEAQAQTAITAAGLNPVHNAAGDACGPEPAGTVISQDPAAGTMVDENTDVEYGLSLGLCDVTVPDIGGDTEATAQAEITAEGLNPVHNAAGDACDDVTPAGSVLTQTPAAGTQVAPGSDVSYTLSEGPCDPPAPNVLRVTDNTNGQLSAAQMQCVTDAVDFLNGLFTALMPPVNFRGDPNYDGINMDLSVEDLGPRDNQGLLTLAQAGPRLGRPGGSTTLSGVAEINSHWLDDNPSCVDITRTMIHEGFHLLALFWQNEPGVCAGGDYTGAQGVAEYAALGGAGNVPMVDNCGHLDEAVFDTELMTPIYDGPGDALSRVSVAMLVDAGYPVDVNQAEPYALP